MYKKQKNVETRWVTPENPTGGRGNGGKIGNGGKGRPFNYILPNDELVLCDIKDCGVINTIWMTVNCHSEPLMLRSLRIEMYWDDAKTPAVSAPLGDFFGSVFGEKTSFENALFADPEGASFNSFIDMPFYKAAKIKIINDSDKRVTLYYQINYTRIQSHEDEVLYFHAYWSRENPTTCGRDFEIVPQIKGAGRFIGCNMGVIFNPAYADSWFGEGEFKAFIDGDDEFPTLNGTGLEDYILTGWGQKKFIQQNSGCLISDDKRSSFYRFHIKDPLFFEKEFRATIQQLGCGNKQAIIDLEKAGENVKATVLHYNTGPVFLLDEENKDLDWRNDGLYEKCMTLFYREDDVCSTAYFYLDKPENGLPEIQSLKIRTEKVSTKKFGVDGNDELLG